MKNVPIIGKFLAIMGVFGLFAIGVAIYSDLQITKVNSQYKGLLEEESVAALSLARANRAMQASRGAIGDLLMSQGDELNRQAYSEFEGQRDTFINFMDRASTALPANQAIRSLKADGLAVLNQTCGPIITAARQATSASDVASSQSAFLSQCQPAFNEIGKNFTAVTEQVIDSAALETATLTDEVSTTALLTLVGIVAGVVIVLVGGFIAVRAWLVLPIGGLASLMERLATGDFSHDVAGTDRRDEIGSMAKALQVFKDNGLRTRQLEQDAEVNRSQSEADRARTAAADRQRAEEMATATSSLATGLKRLSDGDLGFRLDQPFAADFEALRKDFNAAVTQLAQTMRAVTEATGSIDGGAREISKSAQDLSKRTEQQAAALEETAAALDQITANVANSTQRAQEARQIALDANGSARKSGEVVSDAVRAMQQIEQSSNQISNIIGVIDEIAFQTNLLALNAGVEAARAGEAGKGFAVVAQEVRELAQRSAQAAKEIKELIRKSADEVSAGVRLVEATGSALKIIEQQVVTINGQLDAIATSAREQSVGLAEVNTAVNQMDQVTQQNAAMVEESTAASSALAGEVDRLRERIAQFRTGAGEAVAYARPAQATSQHRAVASPARSMVSRLSSAVSATAAAQSTDWEEF